MSFLYPTQLADAARRSGSRRGWGKTVLGIGAGAIIVGILAGQLVFGIVVGAIAIVAGMFMMASAEALIRNSIVEVAATVAGPFNVMFDQSWWPVFTRVYREAQAEVVNSRVPLDDAFEVAFKRHLVAQGYARVF
ncbi:hypothetical protein ACFFGH_25280 [Lysobacter korlensis]|uniref:Uncharacterized protein n=1 Tax=Lysobacter korlensis TaxID=553636 RepID=A0ABV6RW08_9GAMM